MNSDVAVWYVPGDDSQPTGPYRTQEVLEALEQGQLTVDVLCWKVGMSDWKPLGQVEPFCTELQRAKLMARKRLRRIAISVCLVLLVIAGAVGAYLILRDPPELAQGKKLIKAGLYDEAGRVLESYTQRQPLDEEAMYLLALSRIRQYAERDSTTAWNGTIPLLARAEQELSRLFRTNVKWLEKARADVSQVAASLSSNAGADLSRVFEFARFRGRLKLTPEKELAAQLLEGLEQQTDPAGGWRMTTIGSQILAWDPSLADRVVARMLPDGDTSGFALSSALNTMLRWAREQAGLDKVVAAELLKRAETLAAAGKSEPAKMFLTQALALGPDIAETPEQALLCIRLMDPDDAKLTRCQVFLKKWPESPHLADVLTTIVTDAVAVSDRYGRWQRAKAGPYLAAGCSAAKRLIHEFVTADRLDVNVYELAKRLAQGADRTNMLMSSRSDDGSSALQIEEALDLTEQLLAALPDTPLRLQIENDRAQWRQQAGKGTLSPEFDTLAEQVERELNVMPLSVGSAVESSLKGSPDAVHVVQIADGCTADKFNSVQKEILRKWVADGGILWANNDVLSLFDIQYLPGRGFYGSMECRPAAMPEICPILTGCKTVVVSNGRASASDLSYRGVVQMLTTGTAGREYCCWSLVPYGRGWISDVKAVDTSKFDGARFWLNFRLFCLGRPIPGAPESSGSAVSRDPSLRPDAGTGGLPRPPRTRPGRQTPSLLPSTPPRQQESLPLPPRITDRDDLKQTLSSGNAPGILWVALCREEIDAETRSDLRLWVNRGGVLWVETDLSSLFGFGGLRKDSALPQMGQAQVMTGINHALVAGCAGRTVDYELDPNGLGLTGSRPDMLARELLPLLLMGTSASGDMRLVCGVCPCGDGFAVLRPRKLEGPRTFGGGSLEANLLEFSENPTKEGWPVSQPVRTPRGRTPRTRSRSTR